MAVVTAIYGLLLVEGALRKWVVPQLHQVLFFLRDPLVVMAYILAARLGFFSRTHPMLLGGLLLGAVAFLVDLPRILSDQQNLVYTLYGWRNYFFYIPLAFVIGETFSEKDLERVVKWTLLLAVPVAPLCLLQSVSPGTAIVNRGASEEAEFRNLGVYGDVQRAFGLFTSSLGQAIFASSCMAFLLLVWLRHPKERPFGRSLLWLVTVCVIGNQVVCGSRLSFVLSAIIVAGSIAAVWLAGERRAARRLFLAVGLIGGIGALLALTVFQEVFSALMARWLGASDLEGGFLSIERERDDLLRFVGLMDEVPLFGFGLGSAGNAHDIQEGELPVYAEDDWSRHIVELGPVLGLVYLVYRIGLVVLLGYRAFGATHRLRDPLPLILFGFLGPMLLLFQITGQGTVNGYAWIFTGFCLAASRCPLVGKWQPTATTPFSAVSAGRPDVSSNRFFRQNQ